MSSMKDFFQAGLAMEAAREAREIARTKLREAAAKVCPDELNALNQASDVLDQAEKYLIKVMTGVATENREAAHQMIHSHGLDCGDAKCPMRRGTAGAGAGGGVN